MKKNQKNPFHGKWMVLRMECVADDGTWFVYESYHPGEFIWKFTPNPVPPFDGHVERRFGKKKPAPEKYSYDPGRNELVIDESEYTPDGKKIEAYDDPYRVIRHGRSTLHLYWIEHVAIEPDDYHERFILRKYSPLTLAREFIRNLFR